MTQPTPPKVIGLDLSLTCTGVAGNGWTDTIKPPTKLRGHERLQWIEDRIGDFAYRADLIAVEGPAYGTQRAGIQRGHHERAGLWWITTQRLWVNKIPFAVVDPTSVKRYATGKGNADKAAIMLAVARRFPWFDGGEDEADALILAAMAADHLGHPLADMPATHRKALDAVQWPDLLRAAGYGEPQRDPNACDTPGHPARPSGWCPICHGEPDEKTAALAALGRGTDDTRKDAA